MTLSQSALSELLDAIRAGGSVDVMREAMTLVLQELIEITGDQLALDITDDGTGIPLDAETRALRAGRLGLADMRARAVAIGGTFGVARRPAGGTTATLRWPA